MTDKSTNQQINKSTIKQINKSTSSIKPLVFAFIALFLCVGLVLYFCFWRDSAEEREHILSIQQIENKARTEDWEQVLALCTAFFEAQSPTQEKDSLYFEFADYAKFALCLTHQLPEKFFAYAKYFDRGVLFPDGSSTMQYMYFAPKLAYFYYSVGLQNMTMHQSYGCIVQDQSPDWAVETYLKALQIQGLERYGDVLRAQFPSLHHPLSDSVIHVKRALLPDSTEETGWILDRNLFVLFQGNPHNQFAFEYTMTAALTYKEHHFVIENIDLLPAFKYTALPKHFEEGILAYLFFRPDADPSEEELYHRTYGGFRLNPENIERIKLFMNLVHDYQNTGMGLSKIKNLFQDTYWFHWVFGDIAPQNLNRPQNQSYHG